MDSVLTEKGVMAVTGSRISTRSNRKGKTKTPNPKKLWEQLGTLVPNKKAAEGVQELYKEHSCHEAHTFFNYFKVENKNKNKTNDVLLYDLTRVVLTGDGNDYIHASIVDGIQNPGQYIMAQCPFDAEIVGDFWNMIAQQKVDCVALLIKSDSDAGKCLLETTTAGDLKIAITKAVDKGFELYSVAISGKATYNTKVVCFSTWVEDGKPPLEQFSKYRDLVLTTANGKWPICVVCETGCCRSGLFVLYDSECERLKSKKRIKFMERIRSIRQQRAHALESMELMEAGVALLVEVAKKTKD